MEWFEITSSPRKPKMRADEWGQSDIIWLRSQGKSFLGYCVWPKKVIAHIPLGDWPNAAVRVEWGEDGFYFESLIQRRVEVTHWAYVVAPPFVATGEVKLVVNSDCFGSGGDNVEGCKCRKVLYSSSSG